MPQIAFHERDNNPDIIFKMSKDKKLGWVDIKLEESTITIFADKEEELINFKNQVLWAYEDYLRNKRNSE